MGALQGLRAGGPPHPDPTPRPQPLTSSLIFSSSARSVSTSLFKVSICRSLGTEVRQGFLRPAQSCTCVQPARKRGPSAGTDGLTGGPRVSRAHVPRPTTAPGRPFPAPSAAGTLGPHLSSLTEPLGGPNVCSKRSATTCHSEA